MNTPASPAPSPDAAASPPMLPLSTAAEWPDESTYRPAGWTTGLTPRDVSTLSRKIETAKKPGTAPHGIAADVVAIVEQHMAILRQCWVTRPHVWRLAEALLGPPQTDPFWNPWSHIHRMYAGVRLLDGRDGRDGFDVSLWTGTTYVNGPHGDTAAYVRTCVEAHLAGHRVAAVVTQDGLRWFAGAATRMGDGDDAKPGRCDVMSCDVLAVPEDGRMSFEPPPGVKPSSPMKGYGVAMWGVPESVLAEVFGASPMAQRVEVDGRRWTLHLCAGDAGADPSIVRTLTVPAVNK